MIVSIIMNGDQIKSVDAMIYPSTETQADTV